MDSSSIFSVGGENSPCAANCSTKPLPPRVGMIAVHVAPAWMATATERTAQCTASAAGMKGG
ncbi:MAG: hypothetical protein K8R36_22280, partial [Planctomycetales bacterium]|nr:hypothetical protein [Planctomycetales bacterium]